DTLALTVGQLREFTALPPTKRFDELCSLHRQRYGEVSGRMKLIPVALLREGSEAIAEIKQLMHLVAHRDARSGACRRPLPPHVAWYTSFKAGSDRCMLRSGVFDRAARTSLHRANRPCVVRLPSGAQGDGAPGRGELLESKGDHSAEG